MARFALAAAKEGVTREHLRVFIHAGIVLQPKQLRFAAACLTCDDPDGPSEVGFGGARGGGKSHAGLAILSADCLRYAGLTCLLLRKVGRSNRESFRELRTKVLRGTLTEWREHDGLLTFANGSKIILGHFQRESDIDAYLGLEYDAILIEEATTLTSAKYKAITTCCRTSKPGWRPRIYSTTNPGGVGHSWYKQRFIDPFKRGRETTTRFVPSTVDDNRCVDAGYKDKLDALSGWQKRAWRYGDWDIAAGQYFTTFRAAIDGKPHHVIPSWKFGTVPLHWRWWMSLDYGFTHYTSAHLFAQNGDGFTYVVDEHGERGWLPKQHCASLHAMLKRHGLTVYRLETIVGGHDFWNPSHNDDDHTTADAYEDGGIPLTMADNNRVNGATNILELLGDADPRDNTGKPTGLIIPPRIAFFDRCARLIEQLPAMEHDPKRPEDVLKVNADDDGVGGDDFYDDFRYGAQVIKAPRPGSGAVGGTRPGMAAAATTGFLRRAA